MPFNVSISVADELKPHFDKYKINGGSISGLTNALYRGFFEGKITPDSGIEIRITYLEQQVDTYMTQAKVIREELQTLRHQLTQELAAKDDRLERVKSTIHAKVDDLDELGVEGWLQDMRELGSPPAVIIRNRLTDLASQQGVPLSYAISIMRKEYPDLERHIPEV